MQYVLAYKTYKGIKTLIDRLANDGFEIWHGLDHVYELNEKIIGICVDFDDKTVFQLNVTCMACWSGGTRKPLYVEEINNNYDRLIISKDFGLYNSMIIEGSKDKDRPCGVIYKLR